MVLTVAAMLAVAVSPVAASNGAGLSVKPLTPTSVIQGDKSLSGSIAQSDQQLLNRHDGQIVNVMVKLDVDAVASYQGGVNSLPATSPSITGKALKDNPGAVDSYTRYLTEKAGAARLAAKQAVPNIHLGRTFLVAYGGFAASLPANQAKTLARLPGVAAVQYDSLQHPQVDYSPHFIGADMVWPSLGGSTLAGKGVKVGVIDTGIWPEHPMLADNGLPPVAGTYDCQFGTSGQAGDTAFTCNDKMLGAYAFTDTYTFVYGGSADEFCNPGTLVCSARDADGHGTHTSTTATGDVVSSAVVLGIERGPVSGIAPGASVIMYRVCLANGCFGSDSVSAVEQSILDDVDVINFSISGGADPYSDPVELAFLDAYAAGIEVNASAGNAGPGAGTSDHGGPWTNTIGASTWDKAFSSTLHLTASGGPAPLTLDITGVTLTAGITSATPVVLASAAPYSDAACTGPAGAGTFTGKVVVCMRGGNARIDKGYEVLQGGAAGMILSNQSAAVTDLESDNHFLPAIHVNYNSNAVTAFVSAHTGVMATWASGSLAPAQADVMASFSSRGPLGDFIKPDVTAPGVQIMAGNSPLHVFDPAAGLGPNGELYQAIAGTSMSSPHAAGVAALIKASHPSWTPGEIKSAMMTSSVQDVVKEDGTTPADPFDDGAGAIRANRAVDPTVVFDVSATDYYHTAYVQTTDTVLGRINLNLPSIDAPVMPGVITTTRTARNVSGHTVTLDLSATSPAGSTITLTPKKLTLAPNQKRSFSVRIEGSALADGWYFGSITLNSRTAGDLDAVLPVAFDKTQSDVTFDSWCDSSSVAKGDEVSCHATATNLASEFADVTIQARGDNGAVAKLNDWSVSDLGDPGRPPASKRGNGFIWNGYLTPALAPPINSLDSPSNNIEGGYFPLTALSVPPTTALRGDEVGVGFNTDPFSYAGEIYSSIVVVSDGYVIVGDGTGTSADIQFVPQAMPDPSAPNNVLAPYWTDMNLNHSGWGGDVYVTEACDGPTCWIIVDFENAQVYSSHAARSFEVWITLGGTADENITFDYYAPQIGAGEPSGLAVGAENRDGSSAATNGPLDTLPAATGYTVNAGSPIPGGSVTIDYDVKGMHPGFTNIIGLMTTDITAGTAKQVTTLHVTP
jgi:subtilisin family serine protease